MSKKPSTTKQSFVPKGKFWANLRNSPKKMAMYGGVLFALGVVIVVGVFAARGDKDSTISDIAENIGEALAPEPDQLPRKIDGVMVAPEKANPVLGCVMVENAGFGGVRPQSGLSKASVVYEVIVEGGITRFMAVFTEPDESTPIGPVRSARDTYLEFASEVDCAYVHAGGSYTAITALPELGLKHIDALMEGDYFERVDGKVAPHDLFTSSEKLFQAIEDHSWAGEENEPSYESWVFEDEPSNESEEDATSVKIGYGGSYDVEYVYNEENNNYERYNGGELQSDDVTGETLTTKNVIIEHVGEGIPLPEKGRINWVVTGEGDVEIYRGGKKIIGKWMKPDRLSRTTFVDENGDPIELERGNTWVDIVPPEVIVESSSTGSQEADTNTENDSISDDADTEEESVTDEY